MMKITKRQLRRIIRETMELDLEVGDDLGQPTINGTKALNFRIEKLMPKEKWSKKSKEALEFAEKVDEMRITKNHLRSIIRETIGRTFTPEQVNQYLSDNAQVYHEDPSLNPDGIKMLLQDDFMDDIGYQASMDDYEDLIDQLSQDPNAMEQAPEYTDEDHKAAEEILSTRAGSYRGTTLPGGKRVK
jgi:hypothetical protein